jgi:hypothetical protein
MFYPIDTRHHQRKNMSVPLFAPIAEKRKKTDERYSSSSSGSESDPEPRSLADFESDEDEDDNGTAVVIVDILKKKRSSRVRKTTTPKKPSSSSRDSDSDSDIGLGRKLIISDASSSSNDSSSFAASAVTVQDALNQAERFAQKADRLFALLPYTNPAQSIPFFFLDPVTKDEAIERRRGELAGEYVRTTRFTTSPFYYSDGDDTLAFNEAFGTSVVALNRWRAELRYLAQASELTSPATYQDPLRTYYEQERSALSILADRWYPQIAASLNYPTLRDVHTQLKWTAPNNNNNNGDDDPETPPASVQMITAFMRAPGLSRGAVVFEERPDEALAPAPYDITLLTTPGSTFTRTTPIVATWHPEVALARAAIVSSGDTVPSPSPKVAKPPILIAHHIREPLRAAALRSAEQPYSILLQPQIKIRVRQVVPNVQCPRTVRASTRYGDMVTMPKYARSGERVVTLVITDIEPITADASTMVTHTAPEWSDMTYVVPYIKKELDADDQ